MQHIITISLLLIGSLAMAAAPVSAAKKPPQRYTVEILLFAHDYEGRNERFPDEFAEPYFNDSTYVLYQETNELFANTSATTRPLPKHFKLLDKQAFQFPQYDYALKKKGFRPLLHLAWRQIIPDLGSQESYWIEAGNLRGSIKLNKGRFLHLETDLVLEYPDLEEKFLIQNQRKMRRSELHHIDHPKLGILIQIDRYEEPEVQEETLIIDESQAPAILPPKTTTTQ